MSCLSLPVGVRLRCLISMSGYPPGNFPPSYNGGYPPQRCVCSEIKIKLLLASPEANKDKDIHPLNKAVTHPNKAVIHHPNKAAIPLHSKAATQLSKDMTEATLPQLIAMHQLHRVLEMRLGDDRPRDQGLDHRLAVVATDGIGGLALVLAHARGGAAGTGTNAEEVAEEVVPDLAPDRDPDLEDEVAPCI